jgi:hypothetical protein
VKRFVKAEQIKNWYFHYERPISTISLVSGFAFDAIALKRVDLFIENFWIMVHLLTAALGIFFLTIYEKKVMKENVPGRMHFWLLIFIQFSFGGLLSVFLVFYFRSATLATSWPFLFLLVTAFICNESLRKHYARLSFQLSMLFISIYLFAIFFLPVVFHRIGPLMFIASGIASLIAIGVCVLALRFIAMEKFKKSRAFLIYSIGGIFVLMNILYFTNLIPPIPFSLKDAGVYHSILKTYGNYEVTYEPSDWWDYFRSYPVYHKNGNEPAYVFSAVFSPTLLNTTIIHHWQHYDEKARMWISIAKIDLPIVGGREGGYRTYTSQLNIPPGYWRVDIETERGQDIGRIKFKVEEAPETKLETDVL